MSEDEQIPFNNRTHDRLTELEKKIELIINEKVWWREEREPTLERIKKLEATMGNRHGIIMTIQEGLSELKEQFNGDHKQIHLEINKILKDKLGGEPSVSKGEIPLVPYEHHRSDDSKPPSITDMGRGACSLCNEEPINEKAITEYNRGFENGYNYAEEKYLRENPSEQDVAGSASARESIDRQMGVYGIRLLFREGYFEDLDPKDNIVVMKEDLFYKFMRKMEEKFNKESKKHGDSWKTITIIRLRRFLKQHIDKWLDNINSKDNSKQEILDLIDIANYCLMISHRLEKKYLPSEEDHD